MLKMISKETEERYKKILKEMNIESEEKLNKSKVAALYVISSKEYLWSNRKKIFNFKDQDIKEDVFDSIKGGGNRALIVLAFNLFNNYKDRETDVLNVVKNVNRQDRDIVLNAINIVWS